jgi:hypothetical protein
MLDFSSSVYNFYRISEDIYIGFFKFSLGVKDTGSFSLFKLLLYK